MIEILLIVYLGLTVKSIRLMIDRDKRANELNSIAKKVYLLQIKDMEERLQWDTAVQALMKRFEALENRIKQIEE